ELAPNPDVDDEPIATILTGIPAASRYARRVSGRSKRTLSASTLHRAWAAASEGAGSCSCARATLHAIATARTDDHAAHRKSVSKAIRLLPCCAHPSTRRSFQRVTM